MAKTVKIIGQYPLIAICGMDGSGKTRRAKQYVSTFSATYLHGDKYSLSANTFALSPKRFVFAFFPLLFIAQLDFLYTYHFIYKRLMRSNTLVCDRYFYDKIARLVYYRICPKWVARILIKLVPRPTITEFMLTPYVKKEEITDYKRWKGAYKFVCDTLTTK